MNNIEKLKIVCHLGIVFDFLATKLKRNQLTNSKLTNGAISSPKTVMYLVELSEISCLVKNKKAVVTI